MTTKKIIIPLLSKVEGLIIDWYLEDRERMNGNTLEAYAKKIIKEVDNARKR